MSWGFVMTKAAEKALTDPSLTSMLMELCDAFECQRKAQQAEVDKPDRLTWHKRLRSAQNRVDDAIRSIKRQVLNDPKAAW